MPRSVVRAGRPGLPEEGIAAILQLFRRKKELTFERTYAAPIAAVWEAWTRPELLRQWWGPHRLAYEARSWTEGEQDTTFIEHVNELELAEDGDETVLNLRIAINDIGSGAKAKLAGFGMKWGYKAQLDKLEGFLAR